ncbi:MAG: HlyD family efflux transporter periplasmic adaptor subunit [Burkholderiales bacterium]
MRETGLVNPVRVAILLAALAGCANSGPVPYQGYAEGEFVRMAAPFAGNLTQLAVARGGQVKTGDPLFALEQENEAAARREAEERVQRAEAQLDDLRKGRRVPELEAIQAQKTEAQAALGLAEAQLKRQEKLAGQGFISHDALDQFRSTVARDRARVAEYDAQLRTARLTAREDQIRAAEFDVAAARAALAQADWRLSQKSVTAPAAALVHDTLFVQGEWVPAGAPVVSLLPPGNIKIRFFVPEGDVGRLRVGDKVRIACEGCEPVGAVVSYVAPQAEYTPPVIYSRETRSKLVFLVEARPAPADATRLKPGQPVDVTVSPS